MNARADIRQALEQEEGDGARVRRLFPVSRSMMNYDPFVLWDHFTIGADAGFPPHPHRGFEAITYMFDGGMRHEDNLGNRSTVMAGGAQRFTAGRGLVHSEMPAPGGESSGIQLWINLPQRLKTIDPAYQQVDAGDIPERPIEGGTVRVIVGEGSPVQLHTPVRYLDVRLEAGAVYRDELGAEERGIVYLVKGRARLNENDLAAGAAAFLSGAGAFEVRAEADSRFMVCIGHPHGEPIRQYGPYVD